MNITCKVIMTNGETATVEIPVIAFHLLMHPTQSAQYLRKRGIKSVLRIEYDADKLHGENPIANEEETCLPQ